MSFLEPTYLWGLLSLLVPLVIHLLNKGDVKTIKVGSVRYFTEQETKQTRQVKLNELLLLLLRMLVLTLLVFAMASPVLQSQKKNIPLTYLIEPSLIENGEMDAFLEDDPEVSLRFFTKNFPVLDMGNVPEEVPAYWQLAQELQNLESDSIVVFTKARIVGIQGKRPTIPKHVFWMLMDEVAITDSLVAATTVKDGAVLHTIKGDASYTDIKNEFISKENFTYSFKDSISVEQNGVTKNIPIRLQDTLRIRMYYDIEFLKERDLLTAAFSAVGNYTQKHLVIDEVTDTEKLNETNSSLIVWLKRSSPPRIEGKLLQFKEDSLAINTIEKTREKNVFYLTEPLTIEKVLSGRLTDELVQLLVDTPQLEKVLFSLDKRTMTQPEFLPSTIDLEVGRGEKKQRSIVNFFWIATLLVLLVERLLAKFRKQ